MNAEPRQPTSIDRVAIVLPARDEADNVAAALGAIRRAIRRVEHIAQCHVTVVDDGSGDATGQTAHGVLAGSGIPSNVMRIERCCVGAARRLGVDATTSDWSHPERVWLLSTDADSRVREDWIVRHLRHAWRGEVAVAGIVKLFDDTPPSLRSRWWADYGSAIESGDRHPYAHATNLGVRLDAYRAVGRFRDLYGEEDGDLWPRLRTGGREPVSDAGIVVDTSARRDGRVKVGFAHALHTLYPDSDVDLGGLPA